MNKTTFRPNAGRGPLGEVVIIIVSVFVVIVIIIIIITITFF